METSTIRDPTPFTFCSCDIGSFCQHAAAILTKAAKERDPSRLHGRGIAGAVAAALPGARELMKDPPPDLPRLRMEPRFELAVGTGKFTATPDNAEPAGNLAATQTPDNVIHLISSALHCSRCFWEIHRPVHPTPRALRD